MGRKTKMVSFDTSSTDSGYAYFENSKLTDYGSINLKKEKDSLIRQEDMIIALSGIVKKYKPDICVIESPPLINSPRTLIILTEIIGAVRGMVIDSAEYVEYTPPVWRKLISPNEKIPIKRTEAKAWDISKVKDIFDVTTDNDNIADAILIGYARICNIQNIEKNN